MYSLTLKLNIFGSARSLDVDTWASTCLVFPLRINLMVRTVQAVLGIPNAQSKFEIKLETGTVHVNRPIAHAPHSHHPERELV